MKLLDGRPLAHEILKRLKEEIAALAQRPGLCVILVGRDPASHLYISLKERTAKQLGILVQKHILPEDTPKDEVISIINEANVDPTIHGILLQLPLPQGPTVDRILRAISPQKDVDGFLPESGVISPTVKAIVRLIKEALPTPQGKTAALFIKNAVFYRGIQESLSKNGIAVIQGSARADIVIVAQGKPGYLEPSMIKNGAVIIDVGITVINGKSVGDSAPRIKEKAGAFTPVPGGVGPLTVAYLFENLFYLAKRATV